MDCDDFIAFTKEYGDTVANDVLERICDKYTGGNADVEISNVYNHDREGLNVTISGVIEVAGKRFGFIVRDGNNNGTSVQEWGCEDDVGVFYYAAPLSWYDSDQKFHRDDGPAYIDEHGNETWLQHGARHREDGPAFRNRSGTKLAWWLNDQRHREDGPAVIRNGVSGWFVKGKRHRLDGPALIDSKTGRQHWWVRGVCITEEVADWLKETSVRPDWENWGDDEKILFRLRF